MTAGKQGDGPIGPPPKSAAWTATEPQVSGVRPSDRSKRLLDLPLAFWGDPAYWDGWVLVGGEHRRHILGCLNEYGHVPPWAERQLRVAVGRWKTGP